MSRGDRKEPYVEDSTVGGSRVGIHPIKYKGDVLTQVWIDSRLLATLSKWLEKEGNYPRYLSEIVKIPLEILVRHLINLGEIDMIDDTSVARDMLRKKYRVKLNPRGRDSKVIGGRNVLHNQMLSENRKELGGKIDASVVSNEQSEHTPLFEKRKHFTEAEEQVLLRHAGRELDRIRNAKSSEKVDVDNEEKKKDDSKVVEQHTSYDATPEVVAKWKEGDRKYESEDGDSVVVKKGDLAKPATSEELEDKLLDREKKDKKQLDSYKDM